MDEFIAAIHKALNSALNDTYEEVDVRIDLPDMFVFLMPREWSDEQREEFLDGFLGQGYIVCGTTFELATPATNLEFDEAVQQAVVCIITLVQELMLDFIVDSPSELRQSMNMYYLGLRMEHDTTGSKNVIGGAMQMYKIKKR